MTDASTLPIDGEDLHEGESVTETPAPSTDEFGVENSEEFSMPDTPGHESPSKDSAGMEEPPHVDIKLDLPPKILGKLVASVHEIPAILTDWDGWKLTADEEDTWDQLLQWVVKKYIKNVKNLPILLLFAYVVSMELNKGVKFAQELKRRKENENPRNRHNHQESSNDGSVEELDDLPEGMGSAHWRQPR